MCIYLKRRVLAYTRAMLNNEAMKENVQVKSEVR